MDEFALQAMRIALTALEGDIKSEATSPIALGKIQITSFLLAAALAGQDKSSACDTIDEELAAISNAQREERRIMETYAHVQSSEADLSTTALTAYVRGKIDDKVTVTEARRLVGGASKQTIILKLEGAPQYDDILVLRRDLPDGPVELHAADEFPILKIMSARGILVAEQVWADHSPPFGGTCIVTRSVPGAAAYDFTDLKEREDGAANSLAIARVLASIHAIPVRELDVARATSGQPLREIVKQMLDTYEAQWLRRRVEPSPTIAAALQWLRDNIPSNEDVSLVHGDASLRNLMMHEGRETALLDWELWHVGDHNEDLAYCRPDVERYGSWAAFLTEYHAHGGLPINEASIPFWGMFGAFRNLVFAASLMHSFITTPRPQATAVYSAFVGGRPLTVMVADMLKGLQSAQTEAV